MPARTGLPRLGVVVDRHIFGLCLLGIVLCGCQASVVEQAYPDQNLRFIVPWEPGVNGDVVSRILATALETELGQPVEVDNQPDGNGVNAHVALAQAPPDGYTLGAITVEVTITHWTGLTTVDFNRFSPVALVAVNPPALTVRNSATWQSIDDLVATLKTDPGTFAASGTYSGSVWDLSRVGFLESVGLDPSALPWDPSPSPMLALQKLLAGDVDIVLAPLSEVDSLRSTGQVRTLAVMADQRLPSAPEIPTLREHGIDYASEGSWFALVAPEHLPNARLELLRAAFWNLSRKSEFRTSLAHAGFHFRYMTGNPLNSFLREEDARHGLLLSKAGLALE